MNYTFHLKTRSISPFLTELHTLVKKPEAVTSEKAYNRMLGHIITLAKQYPLHKTQGPLFAKELKEATKKYPLSEQTPWGGVPLKNVDVEKNYIRKLLVVKQYGILGFEIHKQKLEQLKVLEGNCLLLSSQHGKKGFTKGVVEITLGKKGTKIVLQPGDEHGIIALTNCIIEEQSTNHLDDLIYIFTSAQIL